MLLLVTGLLDPKSTSEKGQGVPCRAEDGRPQGLGSRQQQHVPFRVWSLETLGSMSLTWT